MMVDPFKICLVTLKVESPAMTKPAASNAPPIMRRRIPGFTMLLSGTNYYCVAFKMAWMLGGCEAENSLVHRQNPELTYPDSNSRCHDFESLTPHPET